MIRQKGLNLIAMGKNIRALRKKRGLTQTELAGRMNCSAQHLSRLENGTCGMSAGMFLKLCRELACRPSDILNGAE